MLYHNPMGSHLPSIRLLHLLLYKKMSYSEYTQLRKVQLLSHMSLLSLNRQHLRLFCRTPSRRQSLFCYHTSIVVAKTLLSQSQFLCRHRRNLRKRKGLGSEPESLPLQYITASSFLFTSICFSVKNHTLRNVAYFGSASSYCVVFNVLRNHTSSSYRRDFQPPNKIREYDF